MLADIDSELSTIQNGRYGENIRTAIKDAISKVNNAGYMPVVENLNVVENGTYTPSAGVNGFSKVVVSVPTRSSVLQSLSVSANGTYTPPSGIDGYNSVSVSVPSSGYPEPTGTIQITRNGTVDVKDYASANVNVPGGGGGDWPFVDEITEGGTGFVVNASGPLDLSLYSANIRTFYNDYAQAPKPTTMSIGITENDAGLTLAELKTARVYPLTLEYYGNVYGNTSMIETLGLALLGDFSQGGAATDNTLSGSINAYSAVILQGIYRQTRQSEYNTSILYAAPVLGNVYWAGMKDRNINYVCNVTFTDDRTVSLSGNRQVIIYGLP